MQSVQIAFMNQIAENSILKMQQTSCFHCGEHCEKEVFLDEKVFCCEGCKMVYSILDENGLCQYYDINELAGISQKAKQQTAYAFLDTPSTIAKLIDFEEGNKIKVRFYLPQIHCAACIWLLENLHRLNENIFHSKVDFTRKEVRIVFDKTQMSLRQVVELLASIGYPPKIQFQDLDTTNQIGTDKSIYYKLGLAGFAFGNIMLMSFPEYLGLDMTADSFFARFFGLLNIALIIPVVFYSGWGYFRSAWQGLRQGHLNIDVPVSLGIMALLFRSLYEILTHTGAGYLDSLAGLIFFLLIGKWFQQTTFSKISFDRDYKSYFPIACTIKKDGKEQQITLDKLNIGDCVLIRHGELIPADAILTKGEAAIDYSFVTGESEEVFKKEGAQLFAGGRQMGGAIEIAISRKVSNSYLTQLWNEDTFSKTNTIGTASALADKVAGLFTGAILVVAFATLVYWFPKDWNTAINAFTAVLIVACPCAVALSIPFIFGNMVRILARKGIYLKNISVIEALAKIQHIVFDKTGTLTNISKSEMTYQGTDLSSEEETWISALVQHSNHPLSRQIARYLNRTTDAPITDFEEVQGAGITGYVAGQQLRVGSYAFLFDHTSTVEAAKGVWVEINGVKKGVFYTQHEFRTGLGTVFYQLSKWANLSLISGDNNREKARLVELLETEIPLFFQQKPIQKLHYVQQLQAAKDNVAMVGDGLNDAGALKQSDVGIVLTENTSNFTPACDIIMDARHFQRLPAVFDTAKQSIRLVYLAYLLALIYNIIGLTYAVQGLLSPVIAAILMPLSSITIVLFGLASSYFLASKKFG